MLCTADMACLPGVWLGMLVACHSVFKPTTATSHCLASNMCRVAVCSRHTIRQSTAYAAATVLGLQDYVDQLKLIIKVLGPPSEDDLSFINSSKARAYIRALPQQEVRSMQHGCRGLTPAKQAAAAHPRGQGAVEQSCCITC